MLAWRHKVFWAECQVSLEEKRIHRYLYYVTLFSSVPWKYHFSIYFTMPPFLNINILVFLMFTTSPHFLQNSDKVFSNSCFFTSVSEQFYVISVKCDKYSGLNIPYLFFNISPTPPMYKAKMRGLNIQCVSQPCARPHDLKFSYILCITLIHFPCIPLFIIWYQSKECV